MKNGTVAHVAGPTIIVRTEEGFKSFTQGDIDKRGVKIMRAGKPALVSDFRTGDKLSAVIITSMPPKVVTEQEVNATLAASGAGGGAEPRPRALPRRRREHPARRARPARVARLAGVAQLAGRRLHQALRRPADVRYRRPRARSRSSDSSAVCRFSLAAG